MDQFSGSNPDEVGTGLIRRALHGVKWVVIERWGTRLLTFATFVILARLLNAADFGLLALVVSITAILQVFVDSSLSKILVQKEKLSRQDPTTVFWTGLGLALLIYLIIFFTAPLLALAFEQPNLIALLRVQAIAIPIAALGSTPAAMLERDFGFRQLSIRQLIGASVGGGVALTAALLGLGVWSLILQTIVTSTVSTICLWAFSRWRPRLEFSRSSFRELLGPGTRIIGVEFLNAIQGNVDKIIVGALLGPVPLGYYMMAQRLLTTITELITSVFGRVALTTFSRAQSSPKQLNSALIGLTSLSVSIAAPVFLVILIFAPWIVPAIFGESWDGAILVLQVLAPSALIASIIYFDSPLLISTGNANSALALALAQNVIGIALIFLAAPLGLYAIAAARSVRHLLLWPYRLFLLRRRASISIGTYLLAVFKPLLPGVILSAIGLSLISSPWANVADQFWGFAVPAALVSSIAYLASLVLIIYLAKWRARRQQREKDSRERMFMFPNEEITE